MENLTDFNFYIRFAKPLILNLPEVKVLAAAWVKRFISDSSTEENVKVDYLKLLLFFLQQKKLLPPFLVHPNELENLEAFPKNKTILEHAKDIIKAETGKKKMLKKSEECTPFICDFSADLLEYVAIQDIPNFGVHGYFAVSKFPINTWDRVDKKVFPKAAKSLKEVAFSPQHWTESLSVSKSTDLSPSKQQSEKAHSSVKFEETLNGEEVLAVLPKEDSSKKKKDILKQDIAPPSRPIGTKKIKEDEDRKPPTWGSNLLEIKDDLEAKIEENVKFLSFDDEYKQDELQWSPGERDSIAGDDIFIDQEASNLSDLSFGTPLEKPAFTPSTTSDNEHLSPKIKPIPSPQQKQTSPLSQKDLDSSSKKPKDKSTDSRQAEHHLQRKTPQKSIADVVLQPTQQERSYKELDHKLDEFGRILDEIETQFRTTTPLKKETKDLETERTPIIHKKLPTKSTARQRMLEARKLKSIPKAHGASLPLEKSIHISPEAQLILKETEEVQQMQNVFSRNLSPEDKEFEALEQEIEEKMKKSGQDPHHRSAQKFETLQNQKEQLQRYLNVQNKANSQLKSVMEDHAFKTISLAGKDKQIASVFDQMGTLTEKIQSPSRGDEHLLQSKTAPKQQTPTASFSSSFDKNLTVLETESVDENVNLGELLNSLARENVEPIIASPNRSPGSKPTAPSKDYKRRQQNIAQSAHKRREDGFEMIENLVQEETIDDQGKLTKRQFPGGRQNLLEIPKQLNVMSTSPKKQLEDSLEDYEMLEQIVEEEMKHQGQDSQARMEHFKVPKKQMRETQEKYINMQNKIDNQLEEYPVEDGEVWASGPDYFKNIDTQQSAIVRSDTKRQEPRFFAGVDLHDPTNLDDIDDTDIFAEELPEFSPKVPQKVVDDLSNMVHFFKDQGKAIPAMAGVPITVPRMTPSPRRYGYDEFGLPLLLTQMPRPQNLAMQPPKRTEYVPLKSPETKTDEEYREPTEEEYFRQFSPDHFKYKAISPERKLEKLKPLQKIPLLHDIETYEGQDTFTNLEQTQSRKADEVINPFEELDESIGIFEETPPQLASPDYISETDLEISPTLSPPKRYNLKKDLIKRKIEFEEPYSADENEVIDEEIIIQIEETPGIKTSSAADPIQLKMPQQFKPPPTYLGANVGGWALPRKGIEKTPPQYFAQTLDDEDMPEYYSPPDFKEDQFFIQDEKIPEIEELPELSPTKYTLENEEFDTFSRDLLKHNITHQPREKIARYSRRQVPEIRKFQTRNVERFPSTVLEEPAEEKAYLLHQQIEEEVEAELAKQDREFVRKGVLDESLPSGLESPLRPIRHVPFYKTPPELKRKPVAETPKKFDVWPSKMVNVIQGESPPDYLFEDIGEERFLSPKQRQLFEQAKGLDSDDIVTEDAPEGFEFSLSPLQAKDIEELANRQYEELLSPVLKRPAVTTENILQQPRKITQAEPNIIDFKYHETKSGGPVKPIQKHRELLAVDIDRQVLQDLGITEEQLHQMNLTDIEVVEPKTSLPPQVDPETAQCVAFFLEDIRNVAFEPRIQLFVEAFQKAKPGWKIFRFGQTLISILNNPEMQNVAKQIIKFVNDSDLEKIMQDWRLIDKLSLHPRIIQVTNSIKQLSQNKQMKTLAQQALDHLAQLSDKTTYASKSRIKRKPFPQPRTGNALIVLLLAAKLTNLVTSPFVKKTPPKEIIEAIESKSICDAFIKKFRATRNHNHFRILYQTLYTRYKSNNIDAIKGQCGLLLQNPHIQATLQLMQDAVLKPSKDAVLLFKSQLEELAIDKNIRSDLNNLRQMLSEISPKQVQFLNAYTLLVLLLGLKNGIDTKPNLTMGKALAKNLADKLKSTANNAVIKSLAENLNNFSKNINLNNLKKQLLSLFQDSTICTAVEAVDVALKTPNLTTLSLAFEQIKKLKMTANMRAVSENLQKFVDTQEKKRKEKVHMKIAFELAPLVVLALHKKDDDDYVDDREEVEHQSKQEAIRLSLYYKITQLFDHPILKNIVTKLGEPGRDLNINALIRKLRYLSQDPLVKFSSSRICESREKNATNKLQFLLQYWSNLVTDTALLDVAHNIQELMGESGANLDQQTIVLLPLVVIALAEQTSPSRIKGRRKMVTQELSRLPGVQETEEEYLIGPKGWDMQWEMPAEERVEFRAPNIKVLPQPPQSSTYQLEPVELEEPPLPSYIPLNRLPFDYKKLEYLQPYTAFVTDKSEDIMASNLNQQYQIENESPPPAPLLNLSPPTHSSSSQLQSELQLHQVFDPENKLLEQEVIIEAGPIPGPEREDYESLPNYKDTPVAKTSLQAKSFAEILSEADRQYQSLWNDLSTPISPTRPIRQEHQFAPFSHELPRVIPQQTLLPATQIKPNELNTIRNRRPYLDRDLDETPPTPYDAPQFQVLEVSADIHEPPKTLFSPQYRPIHEEAGPFLEVCSMDSLDKLCLEDEIPEELQNFKWMDVREVDQKPRKNR